MSKSKGNVCYTDTLLSRGYNAGEIRFFLIYGHYGARLNYSSNAIIKATARLRSIKIVIKEIKKKAGTGLHPDAKLARQIKGIFSEGMDNDLNVKEALDGLHDLLSGFELSRLKANEAAGIMAALREIDGVVKIIF